jgi:hypothetical protein
VKRTHAVLLAVIVAADAALAQQVASPADGCAAAFRDSASVKLVSALDRLADEPPVWDAYTLTSYPVLLVAEPVRESAAPQRWCVGVWRHRRALERITTDSAPRFSTPLYGMVNLDPVGSGVPNGVLRGTASMRAVSASLAADLRRLGVTRAVVLASPLDFGRLGQLGAMLRAQGADPARLQGYLAVHESFHLHTQFPSWLKQAHDHSWPAWDRQPDRAALAARCYGASPTDSASPSAEQAALLEAFDALWTPGRSPQREEATRLARRFAAARLARYARLAEARVPRDSAWITCREAEDVMELEEGAPQWIAHSTAVRAGLSTVVQTRAGYEQRQAQAFYQLGALQLWVLEGLLGPREMRRLTGELARSTSSTDGIFGRLTQLLEP